MVDVTLYLKKQRHVVPYPNPVMGPPTKRCSRFLLSQRVPLSTRVFFLFPALAILICNLLLALIVLPLSLSLSLTQAEEHILTWLQIMNSNTSSQMSGTQHAARSPSVGVNYR